MPIPENPQSRSEQYLNAIATGDNSGLPEFPQSRMEQYLDVIAQNGGGSSGGGVLVVEWIEGDENDYIDATAKELIDALGEGKLVFLKRNDAESGIPVNTYGRQFIGSATKIISTGEIRFFSIAVELSAGANVIVWKATTENDNPVADYGE